MAKKKIFISSVQLEFQEERLALHAYLSADPLLGKFFEPFIFELFPASDQSTQSLYLKEVEQCDIYLGLFGKSYGYQNTDGISPTELEFDHASLHHKSRLIFLTTVENNEREVKEQALIHKAEQFVVRKKFSHIDDLKATAYAALVKYLIDKEIIRVAPFDASFSEKATLSDLDIEKIKRFVRTAQSRRGFVLADSEPISSILTHLNLIEQNKLTHAAILLFGKEPQRFFINSEVRCASFHGNIVEKPIPDYKVFKGTLFELVDKSVDFILSKLKYTIGTRAQDVQIPGTYEIPKEVVTEAMVNAIAHRDYTCNASVQVMLFADRLEIWNPGMLPMGWTTEKLKQLHTSIPANPLMAEPLYLAGYIERLGTGTSDMVRIATTAGLKEPEFIQAEDFKTILYRTSTEQATMHDTMHDTIHDTMQVLQLIEVLFGELSREELQEKLAINNRDYLRKSFINAALNAGYIEMLIPEKPKSKNQRYRLSIAGKLLQEKLKIQSNTPQPTPQATPQVEQLIMTLTKELSRNELQEKLGLTDRENFRRNYLAKALDENYIELTIPEKPNDPNQKYTLTQKGKDLQKRLKNKK